MIIGAVYSLGEILLSKTIRAIILTVWVIFSMAILLGTAIDFIMKPTLGMTMAGVVLGVFSLVPIFVYYDVRR